LQTGINNTTRVASHISMLLAIICRISQTVGTYFPMAMNWTSPKTWSSITTSSAMRNFLFQCLFLNLDDDARHS
jgi:hypothetical protein